jgi:hypothetical protein
MAKEEEHYLIFIGDNIKGNAKSLEEAEEKMEKLPEPSRPSQNKAIYKFVKEVKWQR